MKKHISLYVIIFLNEEDKCQRQVTYHSNLGFQLAFPFFPDFRLLRKRENYKKFFENIPRF